MTGQATSLQHAGTWRRFGAFVRQPDLPPRATGPTARALPVLGKLFALDLLLMAVLIGLAGLAQVLGFKLPGHMLNELQLSAPLIAFIVIGAPIGEEIIFRGWLSGRPGHLLAILLILLGAGGFLALLGARQLHAGLAVLGASLVLAVLAIWWKRRSGALGFFQRHFRWFYYASALIFGTVHLTNFTSGNALYLLPLTLPQLLLGLILGFARTRFGLWSSMLIHAAHNSLFVTLILLGAS